MGSVFGVSPLPAWAACANTFSCFFSQRGRSELAVRRLMVRCMSLCTREPCACWCSPGLLSPPCCRVHGALPDPMHRVPGGGHSRVLDNFLNSHTPRQGACVLPCLTVAAEHA